MPSTGSLGNTDIQSISPNEYSSFKTVSRSTHVCPSRMLAGVS
ncbi:hypothetical protein [Curtobacterium sp. Curtsp57]